MQRNDLSVHFTGMVSIQIFGHNSVITDYLLVGGFLLFESQVILEKRPSPEKRFELQLQKNKPKAEKLQQKLAKTKSAECSIELSSTDGEGEEKQESKFFPVWSHTAEGKEMTRNIGFKIWK